jgi:aspartate carbamoyltransferase catalytic subunit
LVSVRELELADIDDFLFRARRFRDESAASVRSGLQVNLFFEASTRTRMSFEVAGRRLGLAVVNLETGSSSLSKGESLEDTVRTIDAMGPDILVVRHGRAGVPDAISEWTSASVVNAGDGAREHPTQALLDCLTLCDRFEFERAGQLGGLTIAVIGDVAHSRVARSNLALWSKAGVSVRLVGPRAFVPSGFAELGWEVHHTLASGIHGVDAIYALRVQTERQHGAIYPSLGEYFRQYGLTRERLDRHAPNAAVLHPGPVNRGVDLSAGLVRDARSLVNQQVANGVWVRMAVLDRLSEVREGV